MVLYASRCDDERAGVWLWIAGRGGCMCEWAQDLCSHFGNLTGMLSVSV